MHICYCHAIVLPLLQLFLQPALRRSVSSILGCHTSQGVTTTTRRSSDLQQKLSLHFSTFKTNNQTRVVAVKTIYLG